MDPILFSLLLVGGLVGSIRFSGQTDRKIIEIIFERTGAVTRTLDGEIKKIKFVRKQPLNNGNEYIFRLPYGMPYAKIEHLNENIGVFKDGLHKNVEINYDDGMLHVCVYETDLPERWNYDESDRGEDV